MKLGSLVKLSSPWGIEDKVKPGASGIVVDITEPTILCPYQIATVIFECGFISELVTGHLEVISEDRRLSQNKM